MIEAVLALLVTVAAGSAVYLSRQVPGNSLSPCGPGQPLFSVLPVSTNDTCRGVVPAAAASSSWDSPRIARHRRT